MQANRVRLEYVPLSEIRGWGERNPRLHDLESIAASIRRFGFNDPPTVDERTGKLVEGHGRVQALTSMREAGEDPPGNIDEDAGEWLVPVQRGASFASDSDAEAYIVAHNRIVESGGWDERKLLDILEPMRADSLLAGTGFTESLVDQLVAGWAEPAKGGRAAKPAGEVEFKQFDEGSEAEVPAAVCPACNHKFPL